MTSQAGQAASSQTEGGQQQTLLRPKDLGYGKGVACLFQRQDKSGYDVLYISPELAREYNRQYMERTSGGVKREVRF